MKIDRSNPHYVDAVLEQALAVGSEPIGLIMSAPPNTFEELQEMVEASRHPDCLIIHEIDEFMLLVSALPFANEIIAELPYDKLPPATLWLVVPDKDRAQYLAKNKEIQQ